MRRIYMTRSIDRPDARRRLRMERLLREASEKALRTVLGEMGMGDDADRILAPIDIAPPESYAAALARERQYDAESDDALIERFAASIAIGLRERARGYRGAKRGLAS